MAEWMPIETAPKDGDEVLLRCAGVAVQGSYRRRSLDGTGEKHWRPTRMDAYDRELLSPSHWQPLPS